MSLLLDALKKAADDKKKKSSDEKTSNDVSSTKISSTNVSSAQAVSSSVEQVDKSLDLELHINDEDNSPELDESALHNLEAQDEPELNIEEMVKDLKAADGHSDTHNEVKLDSDVNLYTKVNFESKDNVDIKTISPSDTDTDTPVSETPLDSTSEFKTQTPAEPVSSIEPQDIAETITKPEKDELTLQPTSTSSTPEHNINNEQALSALINKSNHHSRSQKKRQLISISLLIALIFTLSGLYYYIQLDTSNQNIYTPQSNPASINRAQILPERASKTLPAIAIAPAKQTAAIQKRTIPDTQKTLPDATQSRKQSASTKTVSKPSNSKSVLNIVRTNKPDPVHAILSSAYTAFNKGNYQTSEKLYLQVLIRENRNRDALLGIAAIAIKQSRFEVARQKYQYLLKLNPRDSLATAGLSGIKNLNNPQLNETQLKFMIKQQPDAPHLYFALGSLYSSQNKWPEAQSAYFSAWSANNKNADYAYNLAVSLDHMNQPAQALNYYQLSLKLMSGSNSNFSVENTQKRIGLLQESNQ